MYGRHKCGDSAPSAQNDGVWCLVLYGRLEAVMICAAETSWAIQLGTDGLQVRSLCVPLSADCLFELSSGSVGGVTAFGVSLF
jgi:hypothetical protein